MYKTLWRDTLQLWLFTFLKIPLIYWLKPRILTLTATDSCLLIRFRHRSKNHVGSMYLGALCVGGELAPGLLTMSLLRKQKSKFTFIIKDFHAQFFKRCEGDVHFTCNEGRLIADAIAKAIQTKERQNIILNAIATVPSKFGDEPVAQFVVTVSIKQKAEA